MIAVSAPTADAVALADSAGITLIALARPDRFEVYTHTDRYPDGGSRPCPLTPADKIIRMANQIARFMESKPHAEEGLAGLASHINDFWEPRMRTKLFRAVSIRVARGCVRW